MADQLRLLHDRVFSLDHSKAEGLIQSVRKCYCEGICPNGMINGTCEVKWGGKCFTSVEAEEEDGIEVDVRRYGCLPPEEGSLMQCRGGDKLPHFNRKSIQCCDDADFCNQNLRPTYPPRVTTDMPNIYDVKDTLPYTVLFTSAVTFSIIVFLLFMAFVYMKYRRKEIQYAKGYNHNSSSSSSEKAPNNNMEIHGGLFASLIENSSASGSGVPVLVQRTISKQISMIKPIGKGRYGDVWLGNWRGENVAVKKFLTTEEQSWFRETEIYQTVLMRHENILSFIASDINGTGWTQMLLITDYHENGSLYDYLQTHCLDPHSLLVMVKSIASGLNHLHTEIFSTHGKPAIAHRDLKSKNILVKRDGECCIADFGLAVKYLTDSKEIDLPPNIRSGTKRYMAPELLDKTINSLDFEAHKKADIYSLSLVFWEMCRRCATGDKIKFVDDYAAPYFDSVQSDPSFEEMLQVVRIKNIRPQILPRWETEDVLQMLSKLMQECWHASANARLSSLRIKKTLYNFKSDYISIKIV